MPQLPRVPEHVAIIMDGNGRWARQKGLPRIEGHRRGATVARKVVRWAADAGVKTLSLYAFSTENWLRPQHEVEGLMQLLASRLPKQVREMKKEGVRLRAIGYIDRLPVDALKAVEKAVDATRECNRIQVVLCLNYGGQQEILEGVKRAAQWVCAQADPQRALQSLDVERFRSFLWTSDLKPVDLIVRTGGEKRISNFLLWDAAYAELYFSDKLWPEFKQTDFLLALRDYASRERRFGMTGEQVQAID